MNAHRTSTLNALPEKRKRFSWGAIIAAVMVGISVQFILNLLGIGLGFLTVNIDVNNIAGISMTSIIWLIITGIIAMLTAGWTGGSLSYNKTVLDNILHGLVIWSLATLIVFFITFSMAGILFNNVMYIAEKSVAALSQNVTSVIQNIAYAPEKTLDAIGKLALVLALGFISSAIATVIGAIRGSRRFRISP